MNKELEQLLDEAAENLKDNDFVELHITLEAVLNKVSNIVYGEDEAETEKMEFLKEKFNPDTVKNHCIDRIMEFEGVTKFMVVGEMKKYFEKETTVLIIE